MQVDVSGVNPTFKPGDEIHFSVTFEKPIDDTVSHVLLYYETRKTRVDIDLTNQISGRIFAERERGTVISTKQRVPLAHEGTYELREVQVISTTGEERTYRGIKSTFFVERLPDKQAPRPIGVSVE
jgi:hypothetical protein